MTTTCAGAIPESATSLLALVVESDGEERSSKVLRVDVHDGGARETLLDVEAWLTCMWRAPDGTLWLGDDSGEVHSFIANERTSYEVSTRAIVALWGSADDELYAVGDEGVVHQWDGEEWNALSKPLAKRLIAGASAPDGTVWTCGANGALFQWTDDSWQRRPLPTTETLNGILVTAAGTVWICGNGGTLLRSEGSDWRRLEAGKEAFHALAAFRDGVWIASGAGILRVDDERLAGSTVASSLGLAAAEGSLVRWGEATAGAFDGAAWANVRFA